VIGFLVMPSFCECGRLLTTVKLNELIRDFGRLRWTASHYYWGRYVGFDEQRRYVVETVEDRRILLMQVPERKCWDRAAYRHS
jgi:hypothetical protein